MAEPARVLLVGDGLRLEPLRTDHAAAMVPVLADHALYDVIGGVPPTVEELTERYARQLRGPEDPDEEWHTWVVRDGEDGPLVGFVQATLTGAGSCAELAWVVGTPWQGRGVARRAAALVLDEVRRRGVATVVAHVAPGHRPSERVAAALGLAPTPVEVDGEVRWELRLRS
ncbi:GNAT family N-acetyltransferase [Phycicoccus sp. HDW14]|uniref:GNAT family N-acetyltransferase n=1 Tax=Phycicoccus sp. HDW14 TaxID=2714941 RepID=UPI001F0E4F40|nr:GNAT family N-acetyltransferase [Phycicoccus sp. HDW14]